MESIEVFGDKVAVRLVEDKKKESTLILPTEPKTFLRGKVIAVGYEAVDIIDEHILFHQYDAKKIQLNDEDIYILETDKIICSIHEADI